MYNQCFGHKVKLNLKKFNETDLAGTIELNLELFVHIDNLDYY